MNEKAISGPVEALDASIVTQITQGEIGMQVETARAHPRSIQGFKEELTGLATVDKATAEGCFYEIPRKTKGGGTKLIKGKSIRLAEMALYSWRNVRGEARLLEVGATHLTAQATMMDLERNIGVRIEKRRRITHSDGSRYNEDMINTTANAAIAIAFRDAVWKIIPGSHLKEVEAELNKMILGNLETLPKRRAKSLEYFAGLGVTTEQVLEHFNRKRIEDLTLEDVAHLRMYATGIKDGDNTIEGIFGKGEAEVAAKSETDAEALDKAATETKPRRARAKPKEKVEVEEPAKVKAPAKAEEPPEPEPKEEPAPPLEMEEPQESPNADQPPPADTEGDEDEEGW